MKLKIIIGSKSITATVNDSPTAKDFVSLLPLTLTLKDFNGTEKISDLPKKLTTDNAPAGYQPSAGDITLYAPWGNLAIFYKEFGYSKGLVSIGKIEGDISVLQKADGQQITIEIL